jgi:ABC-type sugar transport system ATPase subunit
MSDPSITSPTEDVAEDLPPTPPPDVPPDADIVLQTIGITKRFGALVVLRGVDMALQRGEVLGLVGDNGAGKSTFVKILCGFQPQDEGQILLEGEPMDFHSVEDAHAHGIETVYQDLALIPQLTVAENLFLNREVTFGGPLKLLARKKMRELAEQYLSDIKVYVPSVDAEAEQLSGGQRQAIAVARATRGSAKILLLDEPLSAMGARESRLIIDLVKGLAASKEVSIIVIDHNYAHLFEICDRINVMREGRITVDLSVKDTSLEELTELMVSSYRETIADA